MIHKTAFHDVNVVVVEPDELREHQTVVVENGLISSILPASEFRRSDDIEVIDGRGKFLSPGLTDMHAHPFTAQDLAVYLACGVTMIRSMWGEPSLLKLRDEVDQQRLPGPRIITAGRLVDGSPPYFFGTTPVAEPEDAAGVVAGNIAAGFDFVKVYEKLSVPAFDAIAAECARQGTEFAGHIPQAVPPLHAIASGMRSAEHMFGYVPAVQLHPECLHLERWFINGFKDATANYEAIGRGELDLASEISEEKILEFAKAAAANGLWSVPTLVVIRSLGGRTDYRRDHPVLQYMAPSTVESWHAIEALRGTQFNADFDRGWDQYYSLNLRILAELFRAGAGILVGTDSPNPGVPTGFAVVDELNCLAEAGIPKSSVFRAATFEAGRFFAAQPKFGMVQVGAFADLLLVDSDPRGDFETLRRPLGVMSRGVWRDRAALEALLAQVKADHARNIEPFQNAVSGRPPPHSRLFECDDGSRMIFEKEDEAGRLRARIFRCPDDAIEMEMNWDAEGQSLDRTAGAGGLALIDRNQDGSRLIVDGIVRATATDESSALLLSGTPIDMPILYESVSDMAVGDTKRVCGWLLGDAPGFDKLAIWRAERLSDSIVDGPFYYTGVRRFAFSPDTLEGQVSLEMWIGGGHADGDLIGYRVSEAGSNRTWRRVK